MNEQRIKSLAVEIAEFTLPKVMGTKITPSEISYAFGEALAIIISKPLLEMLAEAGKLPPPLDEEEEEEEEEELRDIYSEEEMEYMRKRLTSRYPLGTVILIAKGDLNVPGWLKKEILERRR